MYVLICILTLAFFALQTPWIKKFIANQAINELADATGSEVIVSSYEGFIPISFDLYKVEFRKDGKCWLSADNISLNRTIIRLIFWKNKSLDLFIENPHLISLPQDNPEKESSWPEIPHAILTLHLEMKNLKVDESVFNQKLPLLNTSSTLYARNYGSIIKLDTELKSPQLEGVKASFNFKGKQKQEHVQMQLYFEDLNHKFSKYYFEDSMPAFKFKCDIKGSPKAFNAFFDSKQKTDQSFMGKMELTLFSPPKGKNIYDALFNKKELHLSSALSFDGEKGLEFIDALLDSPSLSFEGHATLTRDYKFYDTTILGDIKSLDFLEPWTLKPIEGEISFEANVTNDYKNPDFACILSSNHLVYRSLINYNLDAKLNFNLKNQVLKGDVDLTSKLNQSPLNLKTNFEYIQELFDFTDLSLSYGNNSIESESLKIQNNYLDGDVIYHLNNTALIAPFIKREVLGDINGQVKFSIDQRSIVNLQKINLSLVSSNFQRSDLILTDATIVIDGVFSSKKLESFTGEFSLSSQELKWQNNSYPLIAINLKGNQKKASFGFQSGGNLALDAKGTIENNHPNWTIDLNSLNGKVLTNSIKLDSAVIVESNFKSFKTTPINLQIGNGNLKIDQPTENDLNIYAIRFPVEIFSYFYPKFDGTGFFNIDAKLKNIYEDTSGSVVANFFQFKIIDYRDMAPYQGRINFELKNSSLNGRLSFFERNLDNAAIEFNLPLSLSLLPFELDYSYSRSTNLDIKYIGKINPFLQMFIPQNHLIYGNVDMDLKLEGPLKHPSMKGYIKLNEGYYENLFLGLALRDIEANVKADRDRLILTDLTAKDDIDGTVTAEGYSKIDVHEYFPYNVKAHIEKGRVLQFDFLIATFLGDLSLYGNFKKANLVGRLKATSAEVIIPNRIGSSMPVLPVHYIYQKQFKEETLVKRFSPPVPMRFDITLDVDKEVTIRGRGLNSKWGGHIDISGSDSKPKFDGKLLADSGTFTFAGKILKLQEGEIFFDGGLVKDTSLNITAQTDIANTDVYGSLKGPIMGPKLNFRSEPSYNQTEILSLLLFNERVSKLTPFQAVSLTHALATLGGVYLGPDVIDRLRRGIGIDQLTFGSNIDGKDYKTIQIGKYITRYVLVTVNRPISLDGSDPFVITASVKGGFQLQTFFDNKDLAKILLQLRLSY